MADIQTPAAPQPTPPGEPVGVRGFKGLNNRADPVALGPEWLLQADNVLADDAGFLVRRPGIAPLATGIKDIHGTRDGRLLLVTAADVLVERSDDGTTTPLATGVTGAPFAWAELGTALFVQSKTAAWAIYPDRVLPWGSLCPAPDPATYPIGDPVSYPPPAGEVLGSRRAQVVVGAWERDLDRSVIYFSRPGFPHEFRPDRDFLLVPGRVTVLAEVSGGLVIGTDRSIWLDPMDSPVQRLADYGVAFGAFAYEENRSTVLLWTDHGLVRALPFDPITDKAFSVTPNERAGMGVLPYRGSLYAVVQPAGVETGRQKTRPYQPLSVVVDTQGITG